METPPHKNFLENVIEERNSIMSFMAPEEHGDWVSLARIGETCDRLTETKFVETETSDPEHLSAKERLLTYTDINNLELLIEENVRRLWKNYLHLHPTWDGTKARISHNINLIVWQLQRRNQLIDQKTR